MHTLSVDDRCVRCGLCVETCPAALFSLDAGDRARPIDRAGELCIACGHCVAVCPTAAIRLDDIDPDTLEVQPPQRPSLEAVKDLIRSRRSIRRFLDEPVDRALLKDLVDVTRWAPTAKNSQQVAWTIVWDTRTVQHLAGLAIDFFRPVESMQGIIRAWERGVDIINRRAPHLVVTSSPLEALAPTLDCAIALTTFELAAHSAGLGTCWAGFFLMAAQESPAIQQALRLPPDHRIQAALLLGRPMHPYQRIPARRPGRITWI